VDLEKIGPGIKVEVCSVRARRSGPDEQENEATAAYPPRGAVFLKLDAQGGELDVLKGASRTLDRTSTVLLEASVVEYNPGTPRIADVISFIRGCSFLLVDIWDLKRIGPMLSQVDLLFTRCRSILKGEAAASNEVMGSRFQWRGPTFKSNDSRESLSGPDASGSEATSALILAGFRIPSCCRLA
jgi:Methyltransferase FkbM domain